MKFNKKSMLVVILVLVMYDTVSKHTLLAWFVNTYGEGGNLVPAILILLGAVWGGYQLLTGRAST